VLGFMRHGAPIQLVLPAFPAKSPNARKVLGVLPDEAERQALAFLQWLCDDIASVYEPGAEILICSDGRVFGDYVGLEDQSITAYQDELARMLAPYASLRTYNLDDRWPGESFEVMRTLLTEHYAEPLAAVRRRVREEESSLRLYRGITRFLFEDGKGVLPISNTALQNSARERAYGVIQRSKAWGDLLLDVFPEAVRLSIHPQPCGAAKLGILLGRTHDVWLTPWHAVAVDVAGRFVLMKRHEAEAAGARLVVVDGRNSHYELRDATRVRMEEQP